MHPRLKIADIPSHPVPPFITWGVWILTLILNTVASYNDPLLFLFKRTYKFVRPHIQYVRLQYSGINGGHV